MGEIIIRKMQPEDLAEVCKIEKDNFSLPWSEKSFFGKYGERGYRIFSCVGR